MRRILYAVLVSAAPLLAQPQCVLTSLLPNQPCLNPIPVKEFGQPALITSLNGSNVNSAAPNLVVGQELFNPTGIAFDTSVTPPRVYVVDSGNNRVLGWSNANSLTQGNFADMVLGQQPSGVTGGLDFTATLPWTPGSANSTGLNTPSGVAVDAAGNVYVSDSGNNRILRYKTPYKQQAGNQVVDLVIGQKSVVSGNQVNQGLAAPAANTLYLSIQNQNGILPAGMAFDPSGNLWAADPGNNRVLMYPAANLTANNSAAAATVALGQTNLTSNQTPGGVSQTSKNFLQNPMGVAVDSNGGVYVTDSYGRALVYPSPGLGATASVVLGVPQNLVQGQTLVYPTQYTLGGISGSSITGSPEGIFVSSNGTVYVADTPQSRIVGYTSLTVPANSNSPQESFVIGQNGYSLGQPNQGVAAPTNQSFWNPVAGAIRPDTGEMWIVDQGNNRVVAFVPQGGGGFTSASRVLGQKDYTHRAPNLLEGREMWFNGGGGLAVDPNGCTTSSCTTTPYLYIADTANNRILGFKNGFNVGVDPTKILTQTADLVIGQAQGDLLDNIINYPNNATGQPSATGLFHPIGVAVDSQGNLWVADAGNARVVRFPAPFKQPGQQTADVVLGQSDLNSYTPAVTQFSMEQPFGLAIFSGGSIAVSDVVANRILVFNPNGGTFTSGQGAAYVVGQTGFTQSGTGAGPTQLNSPRHMAVDSSDRLYVCDYNNNRLLLYSKPTASNPTAVGSTTLSAAPEAITVSLTTGESWVALGSAVIQIPEISSFQQTQNAIQQLQQFQLANNSGIASLALALDPFDNVIVADNANRVTFYYPELFYRNTANYTDGYGTATTAGPTPTMLTELHLWGANFNFTPSYSGSPANLSLPWPTTYTQGNTTLQVTVNGIPAPVLRVDSQTYSGTVLVEIPNTAPSSGLTPFLISNPVTGQIYASAVYNMQAASPGIYTIGASGSGPAAALSYDSKGNLLGTNGINTSTNQVPRGGIIDLWLTGAGHVDGLPADGIMPGVAPCTGTVPTVFIGGFTASVVGSCMSSQFPGVWQINAIVPQNTPPGPASVVVSMDGYQSNLLGTGTATNPGGDGLVTIQNSSITTIYVK